MIESCSFSHKGGKEKYNDAVFVGFGRFTLGMVVNGNDDPEQCERVSAAMRRILKNDFESYSFSDISEDIARSCTHGEEYMIIGLTDNLMEAEFHGALRGYLLRDGDITGVTYGQVTLENEDRIVIGTDKFFKVLTQEAVLADAVTSISAEEWLDFMVARISDVNMLSDENLSALTFIVRKAEDIRI
jgi:hypothetical protein